MVLMAKKRQRLDSSRRAPRQARARDTVEIIYEATAQILLREGRAALNTNLIARRAGISVGTLYQYFPNKVAILLAMARREIQRTVRVVLAAIKEASTARDGDFARRAVRTLITEFDRRRKARHVAFQTLIAEGHGRELERTFDDVCNALILNTPRIVPDRLQPMSRVSAFVLTRAVNGVLASAAENDSYLRMKEFEDELVRLVQAFLLTLPEARK